MIEKILQTTYDMFADLGYDDTHLFAIANMLDIPETKVTYYFKDKETLFVSLLKIMMKDVKADSPFTGGSKNDLKKHLIKVGHQQIDYYDRHPKFILVLKEYQRLALRSEEIHRLMVELENIEVNRFKQVLGRAEEEGIIKINDRDEIKEALYFMLKGISEAQLFEKKDYKKSWSNLIHLIL